MNKLIYIGSNQDKNSLEIAGLFDDVTILKLPECLSYNLCNTIVTHERLFTSEKEK